MSRKTLPEALQALQRALRDVLVEPPLIVQACGETHHFAQAIEDDELAVRIARHDHVEAVGSEIDRGQDIGNLACATLRGQTENDEPQPQVVVAFGLRITNCAPSRSSR